jgi:hypothetical protein
VEASELTHVCSVPEEQTPDSAPETEDKTVRILTEQHIDMSRNKAVVKQISISALAHTSQVERRLGFCAALQSSSPMAVCF